MSLHGTVRRALLEIVRDGSVFLAEVVALLVDDVLLVVDVVLVVDVLLVVNDVDLTRLARRGGLGHAGRDAVSYTRRHLIIDSHGLAVPCTMLQIQPELDAELDASVSDQTERCGSNKKHTSRKGYQDIPCYRLLKSIERLTRPNAQTTWSWRSHICWMSCGHGIKIELTWNLECVGPLQHS